MTTNYPPIKKIVGGFFIGVILLVIISRVVWFDVESADYTLFLEPWYEKLKADGGLGGLATYVGDYPAPYIFLIALMTYIPVKPLYLIKILSVMFDFVLAMGAILLVRELIKKVKTDENEKMTLEFGVGLAVLLSPLVMLNSSVLGQCDSIYGAFSVFSLVYLLRNDYKKSFVLLGLALAFKLQAIFLLPLFGIIYFKNRKTKEQFPFYYFLIIPMTIFLASCPAILFGWPMSRIFTTYEYWVVEYVDRFTSFYPNIYNLIPSGFMERLGTGLIVGGVVFTLVLLFCLLGFVLEKRVKLGKKEIFELALLVLAVCVMFLPCMHERYMYVGEILAIVYMITYKEKRVFCSGILLAGAIGYFIVMTGGWGVELYPYVSAIYFGTFIYGARGILRDIRD